MIALQVPGDADLPQVVVSVSPKKRGGNVQIRISDNGNSIPKNLLDKIFQPFVTTKPTGQGTGLGLYLSYDIVHALGGSVKVNNKQTKGSEFIVELPESVNTAALEATRRLLYHEQVRDNQ